MKVVVKKKDNAIPVAITTEYIKLQDAMKLANAAETGGEAKLMIQEGQILVNGEVPSTFSNSTFERNLDYVTTLEQ